MFCSTVNLQQLSQLKRTVPPPPPTSPPSFSRHQSLLEDHSLPLNSRWVKELPCCLLRKMQNSHLLFSTWQLVLELLQKLLPYPHHDHFCFRCSLPDQETPSFWGVRLFCTLDSPFILRKLNWLFFILWATYYSFFFISGIIFSILSIMFGLLATLLTCTHRRWTVM